MAGVIPEQGSAVVTIERAAEILGIGRATAYRLIAQGDFPVPTLHIGKLHRVPVAGLERFLTAAIEGEAS